MNVMNVIMNVCTPEIRRPTPRRSLWGGRPWGVPRGIAWAVLGAVGAAAPCGARAQSVSAAGGTDTSAYAVGHTAAALVRYRTPSLCRAAALSERDVLRRGLAAQAMLVLPLGNPGHDTLPTGAVTVAKTCLARFRVDQVTPHDLPDLFTLALLAHDSATAAATVERQLALATGDDARRQVLVDAVAGYLAASPARLAEAEAAARRAGTIGASSPAAVVAQANGYNQLAQYFVVVQDFGRAATVADRMIALAHDLPDSVLAAGAAFTLSGAYVTRLARARVVVPDSLLPIAREARADIGRAFRWTGETTASPPWRALLERWRGWSAEEFLHAFGPRGTRDSLVGRPAVPLKAVAWVPAEAAQTYARPGRVTLVLSLPGCASQDGMLSYYGILPWCARDWHRIQRWHALYGAAGLNIVVVDILTGHPLFVTEPDTAAEARTLGWLYREAQRLPVAVALFDNRPTRRLSEPDGRAVAWPFTWPFGSPVPFRAMVIGRDGIVRYAGDITAQVPNGDPMGNTSPVLEAVLAEATRASATGQPASPAPSSPTPSSSSPSRP